MKKCLSCNVEIRNHRKFCSKKCSGKYKSITTRPVKKEILIKDYVTDKLELLEISKKHNLSINTICKYLKIYEIPYRIKYIDFTGARIGNLTIIEPVSFNVKGGGKHVRWKCKCDCGNDHIAYSHHLSRSITSRCRECSHKAHRSPLELKNYIWKNIKKSANERNLEFSIDQDWAYELFLHQNRKCALSGETIRFPECIADYHKGGCTASLDRMDSSIGYTKNNVQWVHKKLNIMKRDMEDSDFITWCNKVSHYNKKSKKLCTRSV